MQTISLSDLIIPEGRVRRSFDDNDVQTLAANILEKGLFSPILLRNDKLTLVAGEHRTRAIMLLYDKHLLISHNGKEVPKGKIPFATLGDLTDIQVREAEIEENEIRVNLTWQEKAKAIEDLHKLRVEQAALVGEVHNKQDTAKEIFGDDFKTYQITHEISSNLTLAQFLDDEKVAKAKTKKEALKIIEKKLERKHREALAEVYDLSKLDTPHHLINGDLLDEFPNFKENTFDCIISDPPYGIAADTFNNQSAVAHDYNDAPEYADGIMRCIAEEGFRVTKPKAHLYVFCDILRFDHLKKDIFEPAGWYVWKWPMIWNKGPGNGLLPRPEHGPRRTYEAILYAIKGDKKTLAVGPDVLSITHDSTVERGAHKPVALYEALLNRSCLPGNKALDPCCGTGPILTAASRVSVIATAIELDKAAYIQSVERMEADSKNPAKALEDFMEEDK